MQMINRKIVFLEQWHLSPLQSTFLWNITQSSQYLFDFSKQPKKSSFRIAISHSVMFFSISSPELQ